MQAGTKGASILGGYMIATGVLGAFNCHHRVHHHGGARLPLAFLIALLSFLGGFIPYIGQAVTSLLAFLVAIVRTTQDVVIMGIYTIIMNVACRAASSPRWCMAAAVSIHPAIVLMAIPAGGEPRRGPRDVPRRSRSSACSAAVWRNLLTALGDRAASPEPDATPAAASEARRRSPDTGSRSRRADLVTGTSGPSPARSLVRAGGGTRARRGSRSGDQAGWGLGSAIGWPGPTMVGIPCSVLLRAAGR